MTTTIVNAGQTSSRLVVNGGDSLIVNAGGKVVAAAVNVGGAATVSGIASGGLVSGGTVSVASGGATSSTVLSGGLNESNTLLRGLETLNRGATATGTIVQSGGVLNIDGGTAVGTVVSSGGLVSHYIIDSQAIASGTVISSGGRQDVSSLNAIGTIVSTGGLEVVSSGGRTSGTQVAAGGQQTVALNGSASGTVVLGYELVTSGGSVTGTQVGPGGVLIVLSGGSAAGTANSGGVVLSGGAVVTSRSFVTSAGSSLSGVTLTQDMAMTVQQGGVVSGLVISGSYGNTSATIVAGGRTFGTNVVSGNENVLSGGVASGSVITEFYGFQTVYSGGIARDTVVSSGFQEVLAGGVASGTLVSGGYQNVSSGGLTSGSILRGSGQYTSASELVSLGGTASGTTVSSGSILLTSGTTISSVISSGGKISVAAGGVGSAAAILSGGAETVSSGGTTRGDIISSGGVAFVSSGGVASGATVMAGGTVVLIGGGQAVGTINSGGAVVQGNVIVSAFSGGTFISAGATLSGVSVGAGQLASVTSGGVLLSANVGTSGTVNVFSGGATSGSVLSGGSEIVASGGVAAGDSLTGFGSLTVNSGGSAVATQVNSAGRLNVSSGGRASGAVVAGSGTLFVASGGVASGATLSGTLGSFNTFSAAAATISGTLAGATVGRLGSATVYTGGIASATTVLVGGTIATASGSTGLLSGTVLSGGTEYLSSGGIARGTVVLSGGFASIGSGAVDSGAVVGSGGFELVVSGATASGAVVSSGGTLFFSAGAAANGTVYAGGLVILQNGVTASGIVNSGGSVVSAGVYATSNSVGESIGLGNVFSAGQTLSGVVLGSYMTENVGAAGVAIATTVGSGGSIYVSSGGQVSGAILNSGGSILGSAGARLSGTVVNSGARLSATSGVVASGTVVNGGGTLVVSSGSTVAGTVVSAGGIIDLAALTFSSGGTAAIDNTGLLTVSVGGQVTTLQLAGSYAGQGLTVARDTLSGTAVQIGAAPLAGAVQVTSGGTVLSAGNTLTGVVVGAGVVETVGSGGNAVSTIVNAQGSVVVLSSGSTSGTTLIRGTETVSSGGVARATTTNGGTTSVLSGGLIVSAVASALSSGGTTYVPFLTVARGGTASATTLRSGAVLSNSGTTVGDMVSSGGQETVYAGAVANSPVVMSGGVLQVGSGGTANALTVSSGGTAIIDTGATISALVLQNGGTLDLSALPYAAGGTVTLSPGNVLTVTEGGQTTTVQLAGTYTNTAFSLARDQNTGTTVTAAAVVASSSFIWRVTDGNLAAAASWANTTTGANPALAAPGVADTATFGTGGGTLTGSVTAATLTFSAAAPQSWVLTGQLTFGTQFNLGLTGTQGQLTINNGGVLTQTGGSIGIANGNNAVASLTINAGGVLKSTVPAQNVNYLLNVGGYSGTTGASGTVTVQGAGALIDMNGNGATVGHNSTGVLNVLAGAVARLGTSDSTSATGTASLAVGRAGSGTVNVSGAGSLLALAGGFYAGRAAGAVGRINVTSGGALTETPVVAGEVAAIGAGQAASNGGTGVLSITTGGTATIGSQMLVGLSNTTGTVLVSDSGSLLSLGDRLQLGTGSTAGGSGTLTVQNGGAVRFTAASDTANTYLVLGAAAGTTGAVTVTGAGSVLDVGANAANVGNTGTGTVLVSAGGTLKASSANSIVRSAFSAGANATGVGTVTVTGAGSSVDAAGFVFFGRAGQGTLVVDQGGSFTGGKAPTGDGTGANEGESVVIGSGQGAVTGALFGGSGSATVDHGSTLHSRYNLTVANDGVTGIMLVDNGSTVLSDRIITIGTGADRGDGNGALTIRGGSTVRAGGQHLAGLAGISIGNGRGNSGIVTVTGAGSVLDGNGDAVAVGTAPVAGTTVTGLGTGSLTVSAGGHVLAGNTTGQSAFVVGAFAGESGIVTVTGAGSQVVASGQAVIGGVNYGSGTLAGGTGNVAVSDGGLFRATDLALFAGSALTVDSTGSAVLGTSTGTAGQLVIDTDRSLSGAGTVAAAVVNNGSIVARGGTLSITSILGGTGRAGAASGVLDVQTAGGTGWAFSGAAATIRLHTVSGNSTVANFAIGDTLDFAGSTGVSLAGNVVTVGSATFTLLPAVAAEAFALSSDGAGGMMVTAVTDTSAPLFTPVIPPPTTTVLTDAPGNQLYNGGGTVPLALSETRRGDTFVLGADGTVTVTHGNQVDAISNVPVVQFIDGQMVFDANAPAAAVTRMYQAGLGRLPDQGGLTFWIANVQKGVPLSDLATGFLTSPEFTSRFGSGLSNSDFVTKIYLNVLGRPPEAGGLAFWSGNLDNGAATLGQTLAGISESNENKAGTASLVTSGIWSPDPNAQQVARLYDTALGRLPDAGGLAFWTKAIAAGTGTLQDLADSFTNSTEFVGKYGALDNRAFVQAVYGNTLGRAGDQGGVDFWTGTLDNGASRAAVTIGFSESTEHQTRTADLFSSSDPVKYGIKLAS